MAADASSAYSSTPLAVGSARRCTIWLDRHVHKNGGTSVRRLAVELMARDMLQRSPEWSPRHSQWSSLLNGLAEIRQPCSPRIENSIFHVEAHIESAPWQKWIEAVRRYRAVEGTCCRVLLTTRMREPLDWYISFYQWGVQPRFEKFNRTGIDWWAPSNMQSVLLLNATSGSKWMDGRRNGRGGNFDRFKHSHFLLTRKMLEEDFDVVFPLDRMREGMQVIADELSLPRALLSSMIDRTHVVPRWNGIGSGLVGNQKLANNLHICPNMSYCTELINERAPYDHALFHHVTQSFEKKLQKYQLAWRQESPSSVPIVTPRDKGKWEAAAPCLFHLCNGVKRGLTEPLSTEEVERNVSYPLHMCGVGGGASISSDAQLIQMHDAFYAAFKHVCYSCPKKTAVSNPHSRLLVRLGKKTPSCIRLEMLPG